MQKTPISILQELATSKNLPFPSYEFSGSGQAHDPTFSCHVTMDNKHAEATGSTKKLAKQNAASQLLKAFQIFVEDTEKMPTICFLPKPSRKDGPSVNYVGKLNEFSSGKRFSQPVYMQSAEILSEQFCITCSFLEFKTQGFGLTKKDAKQNSAKSMLELLKEQDLGGFQRVDQGTVYAPNSDEMDAVLDKYVTIMKNLKLNNSGGIVTPSTDTDLLPPGKRSMFSKWDDLQMYLQEKGLRPVVTVFQTHPLMLCLKVNEHVFLDCGLNRDEILKKILFTVSNVIQQGQDFNRSPLESVLH